MVNLHFNNKVSIKSHEIQKAVDTIYCNLLDDRSHKVQYTDPIIGYFRIC